MGARRPALGPPRSALGARVGQSALGPRENRVVSQTHGAWVEFSLGSRRMALGGSSLVNFGVPLMRLFTQSIFIPLGISDSQSFVANTKTINRSLFVLINF